MSVSAYRLPQYRALLARYSRSGKTPLEPGASFADSNAEAKLNGAPRDPMDHIAYMTKNLFRFKTWPSPGSVIGLNPLGYDSAASGTVVVSQHCKTRTYTTDNARAFWARPAGMRGSEAVRGFT